MPDPQRTDAATVVYGVLKSDDLAAGVRAMLVGEANSVYEAGDLRADILASAEELRRAHYIPSALKALALSVQDAGEEPIEGRLLQQHVVVRVYDRFRGYHNIRAVRQALMQLLTGFIGNVVAVGAVGQGLVNIAFTGRTGHRYDTVYAVEFEAISFVATVEQAEYD